MLERYVNDSVTDASSPDRIGRPTEKQINQNWHLDNFPTQTSIQSHPGQLSSYCSAHTYWLCERTNAIERMSRNVMPHAKPSSTQTHTHDDDDVHHPSYPGLTIALYSGKHRGIALYTRIHVMGSLENVRALAFNILDGFVCAAVAASGTMEIRW